MRGAGLEVKQNHDCPLQCHPTAVEQWPEGGALKSESDNGAKLLPSAVPGAEAEGASRLVLATLGLEWSQRKKNERRHLAKCHPAFPLINFFSPEGGVDNVGQVLNDNSALRTYF